LEFIYAIKQRFKQSQNVQARRARCANAPERRCLIIHSLGAPRAPGTKQKDAPAARKNGDEQKR
jgi:hypothetical protein